MFRGVRNYALCIQTDQTQVCLFERRACEPTRRDWLQPRECWRRCSHVTLRTGQYIGLLSALSAFTH